MTHAPTSRTAAPAAAIRRVDEAGLARVTGAVVPYAMAGVGVLLLV